MPNASVSCILDCVGNLAKYKLNYVGNLVKYDDFLNQNRKFTLITFVIYTSNSFRLKYPSN